MDSGDQESRDTWVDALSAATTHSRATKIREEFLKNVQDKTIVPYNENRAVIVNSNLFHETEAIDFKDGYGDRRINVTMLSGRIQSKTAIPKLLNIIRP